MYELDGVVYADMLTILNRSPKSAVFVPCLIINYGFVSIQAKLKFTIADIY